VSCLENNTATSSSGGDSGGDSVGIGGTTGDSGTTGTNGSGSTTSNNGSSGSGGGCTGTTADGVGDGASIFTQNVFLAGGQSWAPGNYTNPLATETMPSIQNGRLLFQSDSRLKVRFKINSQPIPPQGTSEEYCYGRQQGVVDAFVYTKLKFKLVLRDVLCTNPDPNNNNNCLSGFYLGSPYQAQISQPVSVDSCSQVFDLSNLRNQTQFGTVVEVTDVRADSTCQYNDTYCPAEQAVRPQSCWHMTMQISTDYTQDLQ